MISKLRDFRTIICLVTPSVSVDLRPVLGLNMATEMRSSQEKADEPANGSHISDIEKEASSESGEGAGHVEWGWMQWAALASLAMIYVGRKLPLRLILGLLADAEGE